MHSLLLLYILAFTTFIAHHGTYSASAQRSEEQPQLRLRGDPKGRKQKPRRNFAGKDPTHDSDITKALTINYPLHFFAASGFDWRSPAVYSQRLVDYSEKGRLWSEHSHGQDQEDIWLWENWLENKYHLRC